VFALFAFIFLYSNKGVSNFIFLLNSLFIEDFQIVLFLLLFLGFAVKVPIVPIHV
jgi:NADH:ubiquinone oxidoreductase subunit 4 (subunit M)